MHAISDDQPDPPPLTPRAILRFLLGHAPSIRAVAEARGSLPLGLALVFTAALAREYDGESLWHEPGHLFLPLAASLATSLFLYALLFLSGAGRRTEFLPGWARFLACYWMTAPLAWLYAIPFERFLEPAPAVHANLWLLGIVAAWRVVLIIRVAMVLFARPLWSAAPVVLLFGTVTAVVLALAMPRPIVNIMGGVRHTAAEQAVYNIVIGIVMLGQLVFLPLFIWSAAVTVIHWRGRPARRLGPRELAAEEPGPPPFTPPPVPAATWLLSLAVLLFFCALLPFTQPPLQRKWRAEQLLRAGEVREGLAYLARFDRRDFPPHWDPPPRPAYGVITPSFQELLDHLAAEDPPPWVWELFLEKFLFHGNATPPKGRQPSGELHFRPWGPGELERVAAAVRAMQLPTSERRALAWTLHELRVGAGEPQAPAVKNAALDRLHQLLELERVPRPGP